MRILQSIISGIPFILGLGRHAGHDVSAALDLSMARDIMVYGACWKT